MATTINKIYVSYVKRVIPKHGAFSNDQYNAGIQELSSDLTNIENRWNNEVYPVLYTLPRGTDDPRINTGEDWQNATDMPNAFDITAGGLHGDSVFIDNLATTTSDDGIFWDMNNGRPLTIREALLYVNTRLSTEVSTIDTLIAGFSSGLTGPQWDDVGTTIRDGTYTGNSLVTRLTALDNGTDGLVTVLRSDADDILTSLGIVAGDTSFTLTSPEFLTDPSYTALGAFDALDSQIYGTDQKIELHLVDYTNSHNVTLGQVISEDATVTANVDMDSTYKLINLIDPSLAQDAATKNYVDTTFARRYQQDFASHTDESAPIVVTYGTPGDPLPLVQVLDLGVGDYAILADENYIYEQEHAIATSDEFISIEYHSDGTFDVYTSIVNGIIIYVV